MIQASCGDCGGVRAYWCLQQVEGVTPLPQESCLFVDVLLDSRNMVPGSAISFGEK